jgi:hypothetical protein
VVGEEVIMPPLPRSAFWITSGLSISAPIVSVALLTCVTSFLMEASLDDYAVALLAASLELGVYAVIGYAVNRLWQLSLWQTLLMVNVPMLAFLAIAAPFMAHFCDKSGGVSIMPWVVVMPFVIPPLIGSWLGSIVGRFIRRRVTRIERTT